jgi:RNA 2',3'-cyclic 3'-phosphodiesterase
MLAGVAKERLKSPRARLFVALDLPDEAVEAIAVWQRGLRDPALRVVRASNLHFTLVFLGYHREREIDRIAETALVRAPAPQVRLEAEPVGVPPKRPRLFALDADSEGTIALQGEVERRLVEARFYEPEKRPYWPHLTVARVKPERRGARRPARVLNSPGPLPEPLLRPFCPGRLRLYRSHLRPAGAEYEPLAEVELDSPAGGDEKERT